MTEQHFDPYAPVGTGLPVYAATPDYVDPHDLPPAPPVAPPEPPKWTCETPPGAFLMSLNGFDEIAIAARFGSPILALRDDSIAGGRALAFVHQRRLGKTDPDAYSHAMTLTMQEVMDYFHPEPKKADPVSAEGNAPTA